MRLPTNTARHDRVTRCRHMFVNAGVDNDVEISVLSAPGDRAISIWFAMDVELYFHDAESLERLRDAAEEGAQWFRARAAE